MRTAFTRHSHHHDTMMPALTWWTVGLKTTSQIDHSALKLVQYCIVGTVLWNYPALSPELTALNSQQHHTHTL